MKYCARFLVVTAVICLVPKAWAANAIVVESKQVAVGATGVTLGVYVSNDVELTGLVLPLELRELAPGSFTTNAFDFTVQGRVGASGLMDFPTRRYFGSPDVINTCSGPVSNAYSSSSAVDFVSPDAVFWAGINTMSPNLPVGTDGVPGAGTPSFLLTFDVTNVAGSFEVDTCCVTPGSHIEFVDDLYNPVLPSFQKGTVTILAACNDRPADVNCDGVVDIMDVIAVVNPAFRGEPEPVSCCASVP